MISSRAVPNILFLFCSVGIVDRIVLFVFGWIVTAYRIWIVAHTLTSTTSVSIVGTAVTVSVTTVVHVFDRNTRNTHLYDEN